jgi:SAM-dependent methyltransferase
LVFCLHVFPHFRDVAAALANLAQALRPGGRLVVVHLTYWAEVNAFHSQIGGAVARDHLPAPDAWEGLLGAAGLTLTSMADQADLLLVCGTCDAGGGARR